MKQSLGLRVIYVMAICSVLVSLLVSAVGAVEQPVQKRTMTVFRFAYIGMDAVDPTSANAEAVKQHANDLYALMNDGLGDSKYVSVVKFEPRLAAVQRALKEQKLAEKDVLAPIDTTPSGARKAQKMASLVGAEIALLGSVDKYVYRADKGEVELTATVQLINVATGKVVGMFTATGRAARGADQNDIDQSAVGTSAAYDVAEKLLIGIMKVDTSQPLSSEDSAGLTPVGTVPQSKPAKTILLPVVLLGALLAGFLISRNH